ncbi:MAG: hypothetical protein WBC80_17860, partial [Isosphaeraceae bacterium]
LAGPHRIDKWWMAEVVCEKSSLLARPFHINNDGGPRLQDPIGVLPRGRDARLSMRRKDV